MTEIRCIYFEHAPDFPATDQHPEAERYGLIVLPTGGTIFVDAIGGQPTLAEIVATLTPTEPTIEQKLASVGLSVADLRSVLGL